MKMLPYLVLTILVSTTSFASLRSKAEKGKYDEEMKKVAAEVTAKCGNTPKVDIDYKALVPVADKGNYSLPAFCGEPLSTMASLCQDMGDDAKSAVKKVSTVKCVYGGKGKRNLAFKGGVVTYTVDFDASNNGDYVKKELLDKLE